MIFRDVNLQSPEIRFRHFYAIERKHHEVNSIGTAKSWDHVDFYSFLADPLLKQQRILGPLP